VKTPKLSVLYIDDEVGTEGFASLFELLEGEGLLITPAKDITTALKLLSDPSQQFDAALLDIIMPPLSHYTLEETEGGISTGWRLLDDMRKLRPALPVVVVTVIQMKDLSGIRERGVTKVLPKEATSTSIARAVRAAVSEGTLS